MNIDVKKVSTLCNYDLMVLTYWYIVKRQYKFLDNKSKT